MQHNATAHRANSIKVLLATGISKNEDIATLKKQVQSAEVARDRCEERA
jgi:hypothetical protein